DQLVDQLDHFLHLLVAEHHGAEHHVLRQFPRLRLDHQHRLSRARDDEIELRRLQFGRGRIQQIAAVEVAYARSADRPVEGDARKRERGGRADHGRNIGVDLVVGRHHRRNYLHFVVEAVRKQRTYRTVDEPRRQYFFFGRPAFAPEKPPGYL